jgi:mannose-6-phosphate isomerase-like protein (cupin superfamily)
MAFIDANAMGIGRPLPGWEGRFFHADNMTFAIWLIAEGAAPLHEHRHVQEEVWNIADGRIAITVGGVERIVQAGDAVIIGSEVPHSARPLGPCRAFVSDWPVRQGLPGLIKAPPPPPNGFR